MPRILTNKNCMERMMGISIYLVISGREICHYEAWLNEIFTVQE